LVQIRVLYFAAARDLAGMKEERFSLTGPVSIGDLLAEAEKRHPGLAPLRRIVRVAVDEEIVSGKIDLRDGATVAILPPVAGG
jgi:MoaE-MoaD fusion protein